MIEKDKLFIFTSPDIQALLADNELSVGDIIRRAGYGVELGFSNNPAESKSSGYKEPAVVILASAALVLALTPILKATLSTLSHKSVVVEELVLAPVEDSKGNVVLDNNNQPVLHWVQKTKIIEAEKTNPERNKLSISGYGLNISYNDHKEDVNE